MLINVMEMIVRDQFSEFKNKYRMSCSCEQCQNDILAFALNELTPKYVTSDQGHLYVKSTYLTPQIVMDVDMLLTKAAMQVGERPRHVRA